MNNGVKVNNQAVSAYDESKAVENGYYFKVLKNGQDITKNDNVTISGSSVTINFSTTKAEPAVSGSVVDYALGAGTYQIALYKGVKTGADKVVLIQQQAVNGVASCNTGSYTLVSRISEEYNEDILKCFSFKNTKGEDVKAAKYTVNAKAATNYVYVDSVTFYDEVETGVYAAYTVNVGVSLKK